MGKIDNDDAIFWLDRYILNPTEYAILGPRGQEHIALFDPRRGTHVALTTPGDQFVRHALRALDSAESQFNATFDDDGRRLPIIGLPRGLHHVRWIETLQDAMTAALEAFLAEYDPTDNWPTVCGLSAQET
jgi:hypothetical protein